MSERVAELENTDWVRNVNHAIDVPRLTEHLCEQPRLTSLLEVLCGYAGRVGVLSREWGSVGGGHWGQE